MEEEKYEQLVDDLDPGLNPDERLDNGEIDAMEAAFYRGYYAEA